MAIRINLKDQEFVLDFLAAEAGYSDTNKYIEEKVLQPIISKNQARVYKKLAEDFQKNQKQKQEEIEKAMSISVGTNQGLGQESGTNEKSNIDGN